MIPNPAIRNLIREDKVHQIYSQMQVGQTKFGMQTMTQSLVDLYQRRLITHEEALGHATELRGAQDDDRDSRRGDRRQAHDVLRL